MRFQEPGPPERTIRYKSEPLTTQSLQGICDGHNFPESRESTKPRSFSNLAKEVPMTIREGVFGGSLKIERVQRIPERPSEVDADHQIHSLPSFDTIESVESQHRSLYRVSATMRFDGGSNHERPCVDVGECPCPGVLWSRDSWDSSCLAESEECSEYETPKSCHSLGVQTNHRDAMSECHRVWQNLHHSRIRLSLEFPVQPTAIDVELANHERRTES